jgi:hypothetical protein
MKGLDRYLQGLPRRKSLTTLGTSCRHFQFHYLMDEYFAQMEAALREKIRRTRKNYARWLLSVNAQDTIENRYRFKMWEDAKILRRKQKSKSHHG